MITSIQITNTEIFAFIAALVLSYRAVKFWFINKKRQHKLLKSALLFKKIANFIGKLLQDDT